MTTALVAPGSTWPSARSPSRAARPLDATIERVDAAPSSAAATIFRHMSSTFADRRTALAAASAAICLYAYTPDDPMGWTWDLRDSTFQTLCKSDIVVQASPAGWWGGAFFDPVDERQHGFVDGREPPWNGLFPCMILSRIT